MAKRETMGQRLKQLREQAGMSQAALAKASGVPLGTLRNWEQDLRSPMLLTAGLVARALRISLDELWIDVAVPAKKAGRRKK